MHLMVGKLRIAFGLLIIVAKGFAKIDSTQWPVRIVGGTDVAPGHHVPYQVSLQYSLDSSDKPDQKIVYKHYCGGSIISRYHILTAAHCCNGFDPGRMSIVAGVRDLNDPLAVRHVIDDYAIHPNYVELSSSDIAIIKLSSPLELDNITMAAIDVVSSKERVSAGANVILTGWGLRIPFLIEIPISWPFLQEQLNALSIPTILQIMSFTTISDFECKLTIEQLSETELCAKGYFIAGACPGDSGGPLVMPTENGLRQVGLVSYGLFVCGIFNALVPDVYTRISEFTDWIKQQMNS